MIAVLDHGYVELVGSWGSDEDIIRAARMSTGKGFLGWGPIHSDDCPNAGESKRAIDVTSLSDVHQNTLSITCCKGKPGDEKLLSYLWKNKHETPFEMAGMTIEVKAPIFVFREWHRHRTQSYNEMSARYTPLPDENYRPPMVRCLARSSTNKQASGVSDGAFPSEFKVESWLCALDDAYRIAEQVYQSGLALGIPKEIARVVLPVGRYSKMRASANLRNWLGFLRLRLAENAQWEIRQYAQAVGVLISELFPRTWDLFQESR